MNAIIKRNKLTPIRNRTNKELGVCTKKCFDTLATKFKGSGRLMWEKDGKDGPSNPNNSQNILLDWLTTQGNFARFRGNKEGKTKLQICDKIAQLLKAKEVQAKRSNKNILDKIQSMESQFKKAHDWAGDTGQGTNITNEKFEECVQKRCKYYYELLPIIGDCSCFCALATTDNIANTAQLSNNLSGDLTDSDSELETVVSPETVTLAVENVEMVATATSLLPSVARRSNASVATSLETLTSSQKKQQGSKRASNFTDCFLRSETNLLDKLEALKVDKNENSWENRCSNLEYKMKCVCTYKELKESGWKRQRIHKKFPELQGYSQSDEEDSNKSN